LADIDTIRQLVDMMVKNDLIELNVRDGDQEIKLRRPNPGGEFVATAIPHPHALAMPHPGAMPQPADRGPASDEDVAVDLSEIRSPMVGTFYSAPDPDSASYVKVGDHVGPATVVCLLEAMKVFSEIKAEVSGRIERVLVKNGDPVEFGQALFLVRPS
jgi:acetyl-CoA carboxylase biotin carboxyl carrier protein